MKTTILTFFLITIILTAYGQDIEVQYNFDSNENVINKFNLGKEPNKKTELINKGFFDFFSSGSIQATARLVKLKIGEPGVFEIPFYLYLSASGDSFGKEKSKNENTLGNFLNPLGGLLNGTFKKKWDLYDKDDKRTKLYFEAALSAKLMSGNKIDEDDNVIFGSGYANTGLFFQTGAWENSEAGRENIGIFWLNLKAIASTTGNTQMETLFGSDIDFDTYFVGYAIDMGIEIKNKLNLKAGVYQFINNENITSADKPVFKFSIDHKFN